MKHYLWFIIAIFLLGTGCTTHYYKIDADRVDLYLRMPKADVVYFATSLDEFKLHPARKIDFATWEVGMPATREFRYFYTVDGIFYQPDCKLKERDDFGTENCIFVPDL